MKLAYWVYGLFFVLAMMAQGQNATTNDVIGEANALCKSLESNPKDAELLKKLGLTAQKVPDVELKSRYLAIYCLGSLCSGNQQGAGSALEFLKKTNPSSDYIRQVSNKNLSESCTACDGKGSIVEKCSKCDWGNCPLCRGSGEKEGIGGSRVKCPACLGSGKCKNCNGSHEVTEKCKKCSGAGSAFSMTKADGLYKSLLSKSIKEIPASLTEQATKSVAEKAKDEETFGNNKADAGEEKKRYEEQRKAERIKAKEEQQQEQNERTTRLAEIKQQLATLKQKTPKRVDFKQVLVDPKKYNGQILESTLFYSGYDLAIGYEVVGVQTTINGAIVKIWLLEKEQIDKTSRVAGAVGKYGIVTIQYYVSADTDAETYYLVDINLP